MHTTGMKYSTTYFFQMGSTLKNTWMKSETYTKLNNAIYKGMDSAEVIQ